METAVQKFSEIASNEKEKHFTRQKYMHFLKVTSEHKWWSNQNVQNPFKKVEKEG